MEIGIEEWNTDSPLEEQLSRPYQVLSGSPRSSVERLVAGLLSRPKQGQFVMVAEVHVAAVPVRTDLAKVLVDSVLRPVWAWMILAVPRRSRLLGEEPGQVPFQSFRWPGPEGVDQPVPEALMKPATRTHQESPALANTCWHF